MLIRYLHICDALLDLNFVNRKKNNTKKNYMFSENKQQSKHDWLVDMSICSICKVYIENTDALWPTACFFLAHEFRLLSNFDQK